MKRPGTIRRSIAVGLFVGSFGCAAVPRPAPAAPEPVGALTGGPSVYTAPLKHDAPPELGAIVDTGDAPPTDTVVTESAAAPDIAPKTDGVILGAARPVDPDGGAPDAQ